MGKHFSKALVNFNIGFKKCPKDSNMPYFIGIPQKATTIRAIRNLKKRTTNGGSRWFAVVRGGSRWFTVVRGGSRWFAAVRGGSPEF